MANNETVDVERVFIGTGCNRIVNNVSWGSSGFVSYAIGWEKHYLLSGDAEGVIILWEFSLVDNKWRYVSQLPQSHKKGVTRITAIVTSETEAIFASTSSDCVVNVWKLVLSASAGCITTYYGHGKDLDNKIHLYSGETTGQFVRACELKGHTDWIRSLDFSLPVSINEEPHNLLLVSSSQDKGIRIWKMALCDSVKNFDKKKAPHCRFLKTLNHATSSLHDDLQADVQVLGANMSALGLSQKPIYAQASSETTDRSGNDGFDTLETIPDAVPSVLTEPPIEEQLAWHTLWPESHKLYGQLNGIAQSVSVAEIWLWEVGSWKAVGRLQSHSLTVTRMEFSHDDKYLLAVSRDRQLSLFYIDRTDDTDEVSYKLLTRQEAHKRIVWACSWNPCGHQFATGSRDKTVKIWTVQKEESCVKHLMTLPTFKASVTPCLDWTPPQ
ncbi:elongator complex protein 2 [Tanacetum coccineum]